MPQKPASGEGARLYGGRWNSRGVRVVYASTSLSLAAVETFVNLEPNLRPGGPRVDRSCHTDAIQTVTFDVKALPARGTKQETNPYIDSGRVDYEWTERHSACSIGGDPRGMECAAEPAHAEFSKIEFRDPKPFEFDLRMFR